MFTRYVCVRQHDQSDCGAAALATVAMHHRRPIGLQQARDLAGTDRVGTNLLGLVEAAGRMGFEAAAVKGTYDALLEHVPMPAIAHVTNQDGLGHFVVLHRVKKNSVVVADPGAGVEKLTRDAFCKKWTGYLLLIEPKENLATSQSIDPEDSAGDGHGRHPSQETDQSVPPASTVSPWRRFITLLRSHRGVLAETFLCAVCMTLLGVATSFYVQQLVDSILVQGQVSLLNALGFGMLLVVLFKTLFSVLRGYLLAYVARKVDLMLLSGYARHVIGLPMKFFEMRQVGEILSRGNDATKVREAISGTTLTVLLDGMMVMIAVVLLWSYDAKLAAVATAFVPALLLTVLAHHAPVKRLSRRAMEQSARFSAYMVEDISGVETIKAFGVERFRSFERDSRLTQLLKSTFSLQKLGISMSSTGALVSGAAGIVVLWYGGHRVIDGALTIGQLMFFYTMLSYLLGPLERLASVNLQVQDALVAMNRLYEIMDLQLEPLTETHKAEFQAVRGAIELENVSFRYGCREPVLRGVDLQIPAGSTVAVVGESGSGKSTLLKLLTRFYEPTDGKVLVDGIDMRDFRLNSLRAGIGIVSQDPFIFTGTVRDNIALGKPQATMNQVVDAARAAGLDDYISSLPMRYDTVIGERGANLSGGQRQRLAIARVLLSDPQVLLFDEATSHLDTATERAIQESLRTVFAGKTVVLVAHRLSTIKEADLIYVLHDGQVVERGSHEQLMTIDGRYADLWRAQSDRPSAQQPYWTADEEDSPLAGVNWRPLIEAYQRKELSYEQEPDC